MPIFSTSVNVKTPYTLVASSFNIPAVLSTVTISVRDSSVLSEYLYIEDAGYFRLESVVSSTSIVVTNLGLFENYEEGTSVAQGKKIFNSGAQGAFGESAITSTTSSFTVPAVNSTVTVSLLSISQLVTGLTVFIEDAGYYLVADLLPGSQVDITNLGYSGNASTSTNISADKLVIISGVKGADGATGSAGATGAAGAAGQAATINVNTVTTGAAGTNASVTNVGTTSAALLDFVIPRGETGADGANGADGATGSVSAASALELVEQSSDPAAQAGEVVVYAKTDHKVYKRIPDGTISELGASTGGGGSSTPSTLANKLWMYFPFDNSSIEERTGLYKLTETTAFTYGTGKVGRALVGAASLDASHLTIASLPRTLGLFSNCSFSWTFCCWYKSLSASLSAMAHGLFSFVFPANGQYVQFSILGNGTLSFDFYNGGWLNVVTPSNNPLDLNKWFFIALIVNKTNDTITIKAKSDDGLKNISVSSNTVFYVANDHASTATTFYIGSNYTTGQLKDNSLLDEVMLFKKAITDDEFNSLYDLGIAGTSLI